MTRQARGGTAAAAVVIAVIGIAAGNPYWVLFGVIAVIVTGLAEAWWRWGGDGLEYRRVLSTPTATCGDMIECTVEVTNRKLLPMPWVDVTDDWPAALLPERVRARAGWSSLGWRLHDGSPEPDAVAATDAHAWRNGPAETGAGSMPADRSPPRAGKDARVPVPTPDGQGRGDGDVPQQVDRASLAQRLTLAPFERVRRRYVLPCRRRGAYAFGPVGFRWRDAFGLTARDADLDQYSALVVYPRVVPVVAPPLAARQLLGDRVRPRALLTDPTRLAGVRPFVTGDSVRRVHWRATARTGILQVRRDDPTAGRRLWIVVDVETAPEERWWSAGDADIHETLAVVAGSIASWALHHGTSVGISANGRTAGSAGDLHVPCAGNPRQIARVLDALARLRPWPSRPLRDAVRLSAHAWPPDATIALVTARPRSGKLAAIERHASTPGSVITIDCSGAATAPLHGGATSWRLADPQAPWQSRADVRLG